MQIVVSVACKTLPPVVATQDRCCRATAGGGRLSAGSSRPYRPGGRQWPYLALLLVAGAALASQCYAQGQDPPSELLSGSGWPASTAGQHPSDVLSGPGWSEWLQWPQEPNFPSFPPKPSSATPSSVPSASPSSSSPEAPITRPLVSDQLPFHATTPERPPPVRASHSPPVYHPRHPPTYFPQPAAYPPPVYTPPTYVPVYSPPTYVPAYSPPTYVPAYSPPTYVPVYSPPMYPTMYPPPTYPPVYSSNPELYTVRLVGGRDSTAGRVEIFDGVTWGTICDDYFSRVEATVVCKELGFVAGIPLFGFGGGTGPILMDDVNCSRRPLPGRLYQCDFKGWGYHNCDHSEDVGVQCFNEEEDMAPPPGNYYYF
ncbi:AGAP004118-PA [Pleodorina starrii]|nr:AGAP004118-PA [Pleodorina starrii]